MGLSQLDNLVRIRQLKLERPAQAELDGLIRSGDARLKDAQLVNLSLDSRFDLAYNAAHSFWLPPEQWRVLDQAHRKRNVAEYEGHLDVDQGLVEALVTCDARSGVTS